MALERRVNLEAEAAVIGALLLEPARLGQIRDVLEAGHFDELAGRATFQAICQMKDAGRAVDVLTVVQEIRDTQAQHPLIGEFATSCVRAILDGGLSLEHAGAYAQIVSGLYYEREIIAACRLMAKEQEQVHLDRIRDLVLRKECLGAPATFNYGRDLAAVLSDLLDPAKNQGRKIGFHRIDAAWQGALGGEINTWGLAPNGGKSMILLNIGSMAALAGVPTLYVGTEMSALETVKRHLSIISAVEPYKIRLGKVSGEEANRIHSAVSNQMVPMPFSILDNPEPRIEDIEAAIVSTKAKVVLIDYLERCDLPQAERMHLRVKEFMRRLKTMGRRRNVEIHLASQLSRDAYGKDEQRPNMSQLSEGSAIEKESDRVMLGWVPKAKQVTQGQITEIYMAKSRHGRKQLIFDLMLDWKNLRVTEWRGDDDKSE